MAILSHLGVSNPVLAAPMSGGATTPELVVAAASAGSLGFLAGGYKTASLLAEQIAAVRARTPVFGVNLFAPNPVAADPGEFRRYAAAIAPEGEPFGLHLADSPLVEDDDGWRDKLEVLLADPVPVVSFTFGLPDPPGLAALKAKGMLTVQSVTTVEEARRAVDAGIDALAVQALAAGGHSATLDPREVPPDIPLSHLVRAIRDAASRPVLGAGGLSTPEAVAQTIGAGAEAVMVGTALLLADESGASAVHRAAVADRSGPTTVMTRAFTGRPARGIENRFIRAYEPIAPLGYPALHHLTIGLRRAAAAAGAADLVHLWAGRGYHDSVAGPTAGTLARLAGKL